MKKVSAEWVPCMLSDVQKADHVEIVFSVCLMKIVTTLFQDVIV